MAVRCTFLTPKQKKTCLTRPSSQVSPAKGRHLHTRALLQTPLPPPTYSPKHTPKPSSHRFSHASPSLTSVNLPPPPTSRPASPLPPATPLPPLPSSPSTFIIHPLSIPLQLPPARFTHVSIRRASRIEIDQLHRHATGRWLLIEWPEGEDEPTKIMAFNVDGNVTFGKRLVIITKDAMRIERDIRISNKRSVLGHFEGEEVWRGFQPPRYAVPSRPEGSWAPKGGDDPPRDLVPPGRSRNCGSNGTDQRLPPMHPKRHIPNSMATIATKGTHRCNRPEPLTLTCCYSASKAFFFRRSKTSTARPKPAGLRTRLPERCHS